ncbi:MAG: DNA polymerase III subunit gamma/tau [Bdellovibrio sp.]|nr:DNA polymerase III subunit gamma/tau [Bdellovibrio sp.]
MSYQVLARRLRPTTFAEIYGHAPIVHAIKNSLINKVVGHAYLFTGTRGIGKTTMARLLAKALRCSNLTKDGNPCHACQGCLDFESGSSIDVSEIDGASNNSVDNIRELVTNVHYLPTFGEYKIIIIDEVHMLSASAFNALLKTLEEPPQHVKFIFATTEPDKLLGTVVSRCQRFDFRPASKTELITFLVNVGKQESIAYENDFVIEQLAEQGRGSYRDTLSILEQLITLSGNRQITEDILVNALGVARGSILKELLLYLFSGKTTEVVALYRKIILENFNPKNFMASLSSLIFSAIEKMDDFQSFFPNEKLKHFDLHDLSFAELAWIYEVIVKDTDWAIRSSGPEKSIEIILRKVTRRREILFNKDQVITTSQKSGPDVTISQSVAPKPTWEQFLSYAQSKMGTLATNLMEGNLTKPMILSENGIDIRYGFAKESKVFFEHFSTPETLTKFKDLISEFFNISKENITLSAVMVGDDIEFRSIAQEKESVAQAEKNSKKQEFLQNPMVKEFEKLFNKKIEKVQIIDGDKK